MYDMREDSLVALVYDVYNCSATLSIVINSKGGDCWHMMNRYDNMIIIYVVIDVNKYRSTSMKIGRSYYR